MSPLPVAKRLFVGLGATEITISTGQFLLSIGGNTHNTKALTTGLMAHKPHVGVSRGRAPELNATVFGATYDPASIRRKTNTKYKVLTKLANLSMLL
jgi:hypothetical protein